MYRTDLPQDNEYINSSAQQFRENWSQLDTRIGEVETKLSQHNHDGEDSPKVGSENVEYTSGISGFTPSQVAAALDALADVRIVEMGSNANGEYVKWENGLMMCWGIKALQYQVGASFLLTNIYFPVVFVSEQYNASASLSGVADGKSATSYSFVNRYGYVEVIFGFLRDGVSISNAGEINVLWSAIGRWK